MNKKQYLFTSSRLGFRNWEEQDLTNLVDLNTDSAVMRYFPSTLSGEENAAFLDRLKEHYDKHKYTYFAVELLEQEAFIGFIGLAFQDYEADFTPAPDIGWRLKPEYWGKGLATEGAKRCLQYAFEDLKLDYVFACCPIENNASERVMQKIGMQKRERFFHPKLKDYPKLEECIYCDLEKIDGF